MTSEISARTYPRRQFELYRRLICGDPPGSASSSEDGPSHKGLADELTFAEWQREQGVTPDRGTRRRRTDES